GRTVYDAVMDSAIKNGVQRPGPVMAGLLSKGFDEERIRSMLGMTAEGLETFVRKMDDDNVKACFSSISHLEDEISWGLIPESAGNEIGRKAIAAVLGVQPSEGNSLSESFLFALIEYGSRSAAFYDGLR
ncbi:MAG: hypothetical protein IKR87_05430, partial [Candidatus Methanomethylophilaceae archaeon]|nr:hypothetical protein [Candidatus Methanomethylophilaceae archaeon]